MSTSLLYHAFGLKTYDYLRTEYLNGTIFFHVKKKEGALYCTKCRSRDVALAGRVERIAAKLKFVGWNTIKDDLKRRLRQHKFNKVRYIAIDEVTVGKGQRYLTNVVDLETGEIIYCAEGNDAECLRPFFTKIKRSRKARLGPIAMDMSKAYLKAVELYAPAEVKIIHELYHLVAKMNLAIDEIRCDEYRDRSGEETAVIKGSRYLLLAAFENIYNDEEKYSRLEALLAVNDILHKAYLLKEDLRLFCEQDSRDKAQAFIETWLKEARSVSNSHFGTLQKRKTYK